MSNASERIINASVGPKIKKKVQEIVAQNPEEYRTVSDFVTTALLKQISRHEENTKESSSLIREPITQYGISPSGDTRSLSDIQILLKLAALSEAAAERATQEGEPSAARKFLEKALKYYTVILDKSQKESLAINLKDGELALKIIEKEINNHESKE
jgi:Arc/MetJ-type ribon-helix-helix transcriptional regulator